MSIAPYYQDSAVTIYHGDCREIIPSLGQFDLLLTDPPYGIGAAKSGAHSSIRDNPKWPKLQWDDTPAEGETIERAILSCRKAIIWGGNYFKVQPSACWLAWIKPEAETGFSMADMELAWTNLNAAARCKTLPRRDGNDHPTQKPVALMMWCIGLAGDAARTILDPFAGSGTTGRAAKDLGRRAVLIEREEKYCEISARRMAQEVFQF
jgi:site-specific DNA-methyltransferase (adenine-specific)